MADRDFRELNNQVDDLLDKTLSTMERLRQRVEVSDQAAVAEKQRADALEAQLDAAHADLAAKIPAWKDRLSKLGATFVVVLALALGALCGGTLVSYNLPASFLTSLAA